MKNRSFGVFTQSSQKNTYRNWRHSTQQYLWPSKPRAQSFLKVLKRFLVSSSDLFVENNGICQRRRQTYKLTASFQGEGRPWKRGWGVDCWKRQLDIIGKKLWIAARADWSTNSEIIEGDLHVVIVGLNEVARTPCFYNFKNAWKKWDKY